MPNYRPDFTTILEVLKTDMFTHLLASFPLVGNEEQVTTSCIRLCSSRRRSLPSGISCSVDTSSASVGLTSLFPSKSTVGGDDTQVWYGTDLGKYGVIQFQNSGITHEVCYPCDCWIIHYVYTMYIEKIQVECLNGLCFTKKGHQMHNENVQSSLI